MEWQSIDTAPKDCYCLGQDPLQRNPFVMRWDQSKRKFVVNGGFGDENPTLWLSLPTAPEDWLPMDTAPKDCYCLGYDAQLKRPFVMIWNVCEGQFLEAGGLGDEVPSRWLPLPAKILKKACATA